MTGRNTSIDLMTYSSPISPGRSWYEDTSGPRPTYPKLDGDRRVFGVQAGDLDLDYLKLSAAALGVTAEIDDLIAGRLQPKIT